MSQFSSQRRQACEAFQRFVLQGVGLASPLLETRNQLLLGDDEFIAQHQSEANKKELRNLSIAHRRAVALPLNAYQEKYTDRNEAMAMAYQSGGYTMTQIADYFSVHYMTVSRAVRKFELVR